MSYRILDDQPRAIWQAVWEGKNQTAAEVAYAAIVAAFPSLTGTMTPKLLISLAQGQISVASALEAIIGDDEATPEWPPEVIAGPDWAEITSFNKRLTVKVSVRGGAIRVSALWATPSPTHLLSIREAAEAAGVRLSTCELAEFSAGLDEADGKRAVREAEKLAYHGEWKVEDGRVTARTYEPDKMHNTFYGFC